MGKERGWGIFEGAETIWFRLFAPKLRLEGEDEGTPDARGESPRGLSVITISEDEEGGG